MEEKKDNNCEKNEYLKVFQSILKVLVSIELAASLKDKEVFVKEARSLERYIRGLNTSDPLLIECIHDISNPLTIIHYCSSEFERNDSDENELWEFIDACVPSSLNNIRAVIQTILEPDHMSEVKLGRNIESLQRYFAQQVLGLEFEKLREGVFRSEQRDFSIDYSPEIKVETNWPTVLRATVNLLRNARDHNPEGTLSVELSVSQRRPDDYVFIQVSDNGVGVASGSKIFNRGWTSHKERGNSGLGLYIVRSTLMRIGAQIELKETPPNEGACFLISIPRYRSNL